MDYSDGNTDNQIEKILREFTRNIREKGDKDQISYEEDSDSDNNIKDKPRNYKPNREIKESDQENDRDRELIHETDKNLSIYKSKKYKKDGINNLCLKINQFKTVVEMDFSL
ncbi:7954_t:CDS:1 [Scutellospora calospora]|uniref:7954_t:CDS:1 n=1 Tax=Scutellospora calospora TaxID=85575 RepID=A0ACA9KKC7_9GLOM|nr:7954_t:CDS:1 [Scutellospora calospora]